MGKFSDEISRNNLSHPIRILTDYKRVNKTHFRSEVAKSLWSFDIENESHTWGYWRMLGEKDDRRSHFKDSVLCDVNKRLLNMPKTVKGGCICIAGWHIKWK